LSHFAARLGADVAFFASGAPAALAWGRGERLFRLAPLPALSVLLAVPATGVATADAYRWWDELHPLPEPRGPVVLDAEALATWGSVGRLGGNDLEPAVFARHPEVRDAYEALAATRPFWVRMCGSGCAVAAVYRNERDRDDAATRLGRRHGALMRTATRDAPAAGPVTVG
jgi:4-diphosphocytidyl-2-C-methyl-D-erythritol kinase